MFIYYKWSGISTLTLFLISLCFNAAFLPAANAGLKKSDLVLGAKVKRISIARVANRLVVTAARDANDKLRLDVWRTNSTAKPELLKTHVTDGKIKEVDVESFFKVNNSNEPRFVTALRGKSGKLRLISWKLSSNGRKITRLKSYTGPKVLDVKISGAPKSLLLVIVRNQDGRLVAGMFGLDSSGKFVSQGSKQYGAISKLAADRGTVAVRDNSKRLRITYFDTIHSEDLGVDRIRREGTSVGSIVSQVDVAKGSANHNRTFAFTTSGKTTAVKKGTLCNHRLIVGHGQARLSVWEPPKGWSFDRIGENSGRKTREVKLSGHESIARFAKIKSTDRTVDNSNWFITAHAGFDTWCQKKNPGRERLYIYQWRHKPRFGNSQGQLVDDVSIIAKTHIWGGFTAMDWTVDLTSSQKAQVAFVLRGQDGGMRVGNLAVSNNR